MSPSSHNPYAAPAPPGGPLPQPGPLPPEVLRVRFDPELHRKTVRARLARFLVTFVSVILLVDFGLFRPLDLAGSWTWLVVVATGLVIVTIRVQRMARRSLATYELLVGPRVMRRTLAGFAPSEVLRPEVSRAFETRWGIWLVCDAPAHAFFVACAVAGYDELRATLGTWTTIETLRGWTAWRRASAVQARQGTRDTVPGTALASDVTLANELEEVRRASSTAWMAHPQLPKAAPRLRRLLILWALLIVFFLAIWQFLAPAPRPPASSSPIHKPSAVP